MKNYKIELPSPQEIIILFRMGDKNTDGRIKANIKVGLEVEIVLKQDQQSGNLTYGIVRRILTNSAHHPHGIKVQLQSGEVGRVQVIYPE